MISQSPSRTTETLAAFTDLLRGELATVETYNRALRLVGSDSTQRADLEQCLISHENRVLRLFSEILELGGEPASVGATLGAAAKLIDEDNALAGPNVAIGALAATERQGLETYRHLLPRLDFHSRNLVSVDFYPQQVSTSCLLSTLAQSHV